VLMPLSVTNVAALFVVLFIYGWNQYLWPLLVADKLETVVIGVYRMLAVGDDAVDWPSVMATTMLAMLPPVAVVILMQRWFIKGLVETEK
jgi:sn-glycerol 3-phosphate transport system permease protein